MMSWQSKYAGMAKKPASLTVSGRSKEIETRSKTKEIKMKLKK
jgi:hypothetical protein